MRYNKTWLLSDIVKDFLNQLTTKGDEAIKPDTIEKMVYGFILDKLLYDEKESAFPRDFVLSNKSYFDSKCEEMEAFIKEHLNGSFDIDAVNIWNCNIGLLVAIAVTSTKYPEEEPLTEGLCSKYGKLCCVFNFTYPQLSELGDCFFTRDEDHDNAIIRIG